MASPRAPTLGRTKKPGRMKSAPMEKPTERTRRRDGERERRQHARSHDGERRVDAGVADEGHRNVRRQCEQHREAGGDERRHGQHAEHETDVPLGESGGDSGANGEADEVEDLNRCDQVGALDRVEVERLLVLQRGQGGETRDGRGQEGQGDEDPAEHTDLPDRPPRLPERRRGLDRDLDRDRRRCRLRSRRVVQRGGLPALGGEHLLTQLDLFVASPRRLAEAETDDHYDHNGHGEEEERGAPAEDGGQACTEEDSGDGPDADAGAVGRVDTGPRRDGVVVGQERVVGREDDGLPHGDPHQHDGGHDDALGQAEADGEGGTDERADERDAHAVRAVGEHGDRQCAGQRRRAGDGDDQQDARVGEMERVADVRREDVEGALGRLVEQLDAEQDPEGEQRGASTDFGQPAHGASAPSTGPGMPGVAFLRCRASSASAQSRRS